jgi:CheY-like chemotaxis protein
VLLDRYCPDRPAAVLVDEHLQVLSVCGHVDPYLQTTSDASGRATLAPDLMVTGGSLHAALVRVKLDQQALTLRAIAGAASCDLVILAAPPNFALIFERPHASKPRGDSELRGLRMLIMDDDRATLEATMDVFRLAGAIVHGATSAAEGARVLEQFAVQVLVSDISMPDEDGHAFIRRLRAHGTAACDANLPALALTSLGSDEDRRQALAAGYQRHMAKPADINQLRDAVIELLGLRSPADRT